MGYREDWIEELGGEVDIPDPDRSHFVLPLILSPSEILELLGHAPPALRLYYAAALRPAEPWQLGPLEGNVLTVNGRQLVLDQQTAQEFPSLSLPSGPEQLTAWLRAAAERTGLLAKFQGAGRQLTLNALRHACASHCLANGMDLITLYYQLGHQWVDLTQIYIRTAVTNFGSAYAAAHPFMQARLRPPACWCHREFPLEEEDDEEDELLRGAPFARLTLEEVQRMLKAAKKERERAMVRTFYASGIRQGELLQLRFLDLRPDECSLFIRRGKKRKDRYVLVDPETMADLLALRGQKPQDARIFPLSVQVAHRYLQEIAQRIGLTQKYAALGQRVSAHSLRNTFATHCYLGGMSLLTLRLLLGHSTLASTLDYLECSPQHRQKVYQASHVSEQSEWRDELLGELLNPPDQAHLQLPLILSRREIAGVLACPRHSRKWRVLYGTGMRPHEYLQVQFTDQGQLQLPGRILALDPETLAELKAHPPQGDLQQAWRETAATTGLDRKFAAIGRPLHPQSLRHAFASHRIEDGMDLVTLYYQLGHRLINTTKLYLRTALRQNQREYHNSHPLCRPQLVRTPQAHLTIADVLALVQAHKKPQARLTLRTFYASALRLAELQTLLGADLTAEENRLFVRCGKDSIDRYVLIDPTTAQLLSQLAANPQQPLFEPVAERTLRNWICQAAQNLGILEKYQATGFTISPHGLRHAYASHCYQQGMTPNCLRELLGHSWLQDTLIYADCPLEFRQQVVARTHPLSLGATDFDR